MFGLFESFDEAAPLVSIVIPSYNHVAFVAQCIESVIAQDYPNIELLIIDDGSVDGSLAVIQEYAERCQARFVRFALIARENKGLAATLNEAMAWAEGRYFSAIASDDELLPSKTSFLLTNLNNEPNVAGVFCGCEYIDAHGLKIGEESAAAAYYSFDQIIRHRHSLQASTQLLDMALLKRVGGYPTDLYIEDWYMWLRLSEAGYVLKNLPDILVRYRYHGTNISKNRLKMFEARKQILSYFKAHPLYGISLANMCVWAAIDFSCVSKWQSLGYLAEAVASSWRILFTRYFAKGVLRWLSPCFLIKHAESLKARWPKLFAYLPDRF